MASSRAVDYDALSKTTRIIDITDDARNQKIIQSLILGNPSRLRICEEAYNGREYRPGSSEQLGWLGHFAKESANFEEFGIRGSDAFYNAATNLSMNSLKIWENAIESGSCISNISVW